MMQYVQEVFDVAHVPIDFEIIEHAEGNEDAILSSVQRNAVAIKVGLELSRNLQKYVVLSSVCSHIVNRLLF